jgi:hypothetical protein
MPKHRRRLTRPGRFLRVYPYVASRKPSTSAEVVLPKVSADDPFIGREHILMDRK